MTADELRKRHRRFLRSSDRSEALRLERDDAIRQMAAQGLTHAEIHRLLDGGITRARIGQIAHGRSDR